MENNTLFNHHPPGQCLPQFAVVKTYLTILIACLWCNVPTTATWCFDLTFCIVIVESSDLLKNFFFKWRHHGPDFSWLYERGLDLFGRVPFFDDQMSETTFSIIYSMYYGASKFVLIMCFLRLVKFCLDTIVDFLLITSDLCFIRHFLKAFGLVVCINRIFQLWSII